MDDLSVAIHDLDEHLVRLRGGDEKQAGLDLIGEECLHGFVTMRRCCPPLLLGGPEDRSVGVFKFAQLWDRGELTCGDEHPCPEDAEHADDARAKARHLAGKPVFHWSFLTGRGHVIRAGCKRERLPPLVDALREVLTVATGPVVMLAETLPASTGSSRRSSTDELMSAGSMLKARELGKVRMEGKDYVMQDGDVVEFRFNG